MLRIICLFAILVGSFFPGACEAALLASYNFNSLSSSFADGVTAGPIVPEMTSGGQPRISAIGGQGVFLQTGSTAWSWSASFTLTSLATPTILVEGFDFQLSSTSGGGSVRIRNSVDSQVFVASAPVAGFKQFTYSPGISGSSVTFYIDRASDGNGNFAAVMDDLNVYGVVPEPASCLVMVGLIGGLACRRRLVSGLQR